MGRWFEGHLNWAYLIGLVGAGVSSLSSQATPSGAFGGDPAFGRLRGWVVLIPVTLWVLAQKGRSPAWFVLALVPFLWWMPLVLKNQDEEPPKEAARSVDVSRL